MSETEAAYSVMVVLEQEYGDRLLTLPQHLPVWIVDSAINRAAAEKAWAQREGGSHLHGVTTFKHDQSASREEKLIAELGVIDLHHGVYSAEPFTVLDVVGAPVTERIKSKLSEFGFDQFQTTGEGFRAIRPLPVEDAE